MRRSLNFKKIIALFILFSVLLTGCSLPITEDSLNTKPPQEKVETVYERKVSVGEDLVELSHGFFFRFGGFVSDSRYSLVLQRNFQTDDTTYYYYHVDQPEFVIPKFDAKIELMEYDSIENTIKVKVTK